MHGGLIGSSGLGALESRAERVLAGRVAGVLYLTASASVLLMLPLPGPEFTHPWVVWAAAAIGAAWGAAALVAVPWERAPAAVSHMSTCGGFVLVALVAAGTGGTESPARDFLIFIVVYVAFFYPVREAIPYVAGCALVGALPLVYDSGAVDEGIVHELLAAVPSYVVVGGTIMLGRRVIGRIGAEQRRLGAEQASLRKMATLVAAGSPPNALFALVSSETRRLLGSDAAGVVKFDPSGDAIVLASTARSGRPFEPGTRLTLGERSELAHVRDTARPCRIDCEDAESGNRYRSRVCVPFFVEGHLWGGLCLGVREAGGLEPDAEERLLDFAELLSVAIANAEDRERLVFEAGRDILTGVGNHRSFATRLEEEVGRARRQGGEVALAVVDIDRFRTLNERVGHDTADKVLVELAALLRDVTRAEDTVARVHGDEFALIMPNVDRRAAVVVTERLRQRVASTLFPGANRLTVSVGVSDLETASDADTLVRFANGALYWAKAHGRDSSWIYDPAVVRSLSAHERAEYLERSQGLVGLHALARAIDAKDPTTREHSERVAELAERLARTLGWSPKRAARLREAALVHDVGKIGVPDAILLKPSSLTLEEYEAVKEHAVLSAQIVEGVLSEEQVEWVRSHHERPDGSGYPHGLRGSRIPDGAAIIALADSWDVMTAPRLYSEPKERGAALEECRELIGSQFDRRCVVALETLFERGELALPPTGELAGVSP
jgi:diguanylate cyclase (GGDEF)-like protein/putative nucleotidyltransferase with HDIG domain